MGACKMAMGGDWHAVELGEKGSVPEACMGAGSWSLWQEVAESNYVGWTVK